MHMEGNVRGHTTPQDLGARAQLLVEKHAAYIKKVADVSHLRQLSMIVSALEYVNDADVFP